MEHLKCQVEGAGLAIYVATLQEIWRREETWAGSQTALQQLVSFTNQPIINVVLSFR